MSDTTTGRTFCSWCGHETGPFYRVVPNEAGTLVRVHHSCAEKMLAQTVVKKPEPPDAA